MDLQKVILMSPVHIAAVGAGAQNIHQGDAVMERVDVADPVMSAKLTELVIISFRLDKVTQRRDDRVPGGVQHQGRIILFVIGRGGFGDAAVKRSQVRALRRTENLVPVDVHHHLLHNVTVQYIDQEQSFIDTAGVMAQLHIGGGLRIQNAHLLPTGVDDHIGRVSPAAPAVLENGVAVLGEFTVSLGGHKHQVQIVVHVIAGALAPVDGDDRLPLLVQVAHEVVVLPQLSLIGDEAAVEIVAHRVPSAIEGREHSGPCLVNKVALAFAVLQGCDNLRQPVAERVGRLKLGRDHHPALSVHIAIEAGLPVVESGHPLAEHTGKAEVEGRQVFKAGEVQQVPLCVRVVDV